MAYETKDDAVKRQLENSNKPKKNPVGKFDNMSWDKESLKREVEGCSDDTEINWSKLAVRYEIRNTKGEIAKNGGQIAKQYVEAVGVDTTRFKRKLNEDGPRIRKRKRIGAGGEISIPTPSTNENLKEELKASILKGEYSLGELIVPKKYEKHVLQEDGKVVKKEFYVQGRKHPLIEIRKKLLSKHENLMRSRMNQEYTLMTHEEIINQLKSINEYREGESTEDMQKRLKTLERTRHMKVWHDQSTIANHSHLVFMVACIYDSAVFYTNDEYYAKYHRNVDVQTLVETPEIYIVSRCSGTDYEQLAYGDTRIECLYELNDKIQTTQGNEIMDVLRFFHGDGPARQFESGQQKGGLYYCSVCGVRAHRVYELDYSLRCKHVTMEDRQKLILKGSVSRKRSLGKINTPLQGLNVEELTQELASREIYDGDRKKEKEKLLAEEMHGVHRVPALLYTNPEVPLQSLNCQDYEILPFEPLHDIGKHIDNVFTELPAHLPVNEASTITKIVDVSLADKNTKRTFDYRCTLIKVAYHSRGKISAKPQALLDTLVEIQEIAYGSEEARTPKQILRFHNLAWYHSILCTEVVGFKLKKLTTRKFYGSYFHNISSHAAVQNRIVSGKSSHVEEQERIFNTLKNISKTTSSYHPDQIVGNIFIRLQAEEKLKAMCSQQSLPAKQQAEVSKLSSILPPFPNTVHSLDFLNEHSSSWQAHLEKISDYLLVGEGVWWRKDSKGNVEFLDGAKEEVAREVGPHLHHFRSTNFTEEEKHLKECWSLCLSRNLSLPLQVLRTPDENDNMVLSTHNSANDEVIESLSEHDHDHGITAENVIAFKEIENPIAIENGQQSKTDTIQELTDLNTCESTLPQGITHTEDNSETYNLSSRLSQSAKVVLGLTTDVIRFDKARKKHKQFPHKKDYFNVYMETVAMMHCLISGQERKLKAEVAAWEKEFYSQNECQLPSLDDMAKDSSIASKLEKLRHAKALLKKFQSGTKRVEKKNGGQPSTASESVTCIKRT